MTNLTSKSSLLSLHLSFGDVKELASSILFSSRTRLTVRSEKPRERPQTCNNLHSNDAILPLLTSPTPELESTINIITVHFVEI